VTVAEWNARVKPGHDDGLLRLIDMTRFATQQSGPSQRQLRVGELVRHALADVLSRGGAGPDFDGVLVSIAEVRMSPDMKRATVLVSPLATTGADELVDKLNRSARMLRGRITPALRQMRSMPDLKFRLDTRFEDDARIDQLLRSPEVARDLAPRSTDDKGEN
jgi:ribosome-binding factor A